MSTDVLRLAVERLTFGFDALAHHERQVVFLPYGAPGDQVEARVVERRGGYLRAAITAVDRPGPDRVLPGCRWFPTCGGCQWQHVSPAGQRRAKAVVLAEQLARLAGLRDVVVEPAVPSPEDWGYRARITLMVEGRRLGYLRARSHDLVEIADCPIAAPAVSAHLEAARALVDALRVPLRRLAIVAVPGGVALVGFAAGHPGKADVDVAERLLAGDASVRGIVLAGLGTRLVTGDPTVAVPLEDGLTLEVPADVFTQVNPGANRELVRVVTAAASGSNPGARVLDLYAGAGNFALPASRRGASVIAVERDDLAVAAGQANAARLGLPVTFRCAAVADALAGLAGPFDTAILDPPRRGAPEAVAALGTLRVPRIVYVSCDPATLARDLRALAGHGYRVVRVQPVDLFPQTYHIESVTELHLT